MKNESNINVTEKENLVKEQEPLYIQRESFVGSNGEDYWSYFLKGKIRSRVVKVDFIPKDKGGYEPLDILFEIEQKVKLIISDEEMVDNSGKTLKYKSYNLIAVDENGLEYSCGVRPARDSDKSLLNMILAERERACSVEKKTM